jgi:hypothetical protein
MGQPTATAPPSYAMPFYVPASSASAPAAASGAPLGPTAIEPLPPEHEKCLGQDGTKADCKAALDRVGQSAAHADKVLAVYERGCALKLPLLGCGAFKSTAVTDADRPMIALLAQCEAGRSEPCEDVKTKSAPLQAWLTTLKRDWCKKGETALCANYKECKAPTQWGCHDAQGTKVCGCVPRCKDGTVMASAKSRTWPDGSTRGAFVCVTGGAKQAP